MIIRLFFPFFLSFLVFFGWIIVIESISNKYQFGEAREDASSSISSSFLTSLRKSLFDTNPNIHSDEGDQRERLFLRDNQIRNSNNNHNNINHINHIEDYYDWWDSNILKLSSFMSDRFLELSQQIHSVSRGYLEFLKGSTPVTTLGSPVSFSTLAPTRSPTRTPSAIPTITPTASPTEFSTSNISEPSSAPSSAPSQSPTVSVLATFTTYEINQGGVYSYKGYRKQFIVNTADPVTITANGGINHYKMLRIPNSQLTITDFETATDLIDILVFPELQTLNSVGYSTYPLVIFLLFDIKIYLTGYSIMTLTDENFLFVTPQIVAQNNEANNSNYSFWSTDLIASLVVLGTLSLMVVFLNAYYGRLKRYFQLEQYQPDEEDDEYEAEDIEHRKSNLEKFRQMLQRSVGRKIDGIDTNHRNFATDNFAALEPPNRFVRQRNYADHVIKPSNPEQPNNPVLPHGAANNQTLSTPEPLVKRQTITNKPRNTLAKSSIHSSEEKNSDEAEPPIVTRKSSRKTKIRKKPSDEISNSNKHNNNYYLNTVSLTPAANNRKSVRKTTVQKEKRKEIKMVNKFQYETVSLASSNTSYSPMHASYDVVDVALDDFDDNDELDDEDFDISDWTLSEGEEDEDFQEV